MKNSYKKSLIGIVILLSFLSASLALGKAKFVSFLVKVKVVSFDAKTITVKYKKTTLRVPRNSIVQKNDRSPISGEMIEIDMFKVSPKTKITKTKK